MRRFIRNSPQLYPIYVKWFLRNHSAVFPDSQTQLHLTGFQRSANTYCYNIIRSALPDLRISTHIYTTASLKLAKQHGVPTILLLRDPFSTCGSYLLKYDVVADERNLNSVLKDYHEYHSYALDHAGELKIISFKNAISGPEYILRYVVSMLGLQLTEDQIISGAAEGQRLAESKEAQKKPEGSSLPTEERTRNKELLRERFESIPLYHETHNLYQQLLKQETLIQNL